ncbi:unnamed protein product [Macrosiphum euphorbiae]|uniref:Uncharacterized protein n=1 Tax=Macrosiphum euphorbiae TaxID=13131 RepID=A0AAV0Y5R2_9HEMI|nr:unnamed protein product [Macrosiphum euphorbiae]
MGGLGKCTSQVLPEFDVLIFGRILNNTQPSQNVTDWAEDGYNDILEPHMLAHVAVWKQYGFGKARNTPEFGKCNFGSKPTALAVLSQTQTTSLLNQTEQHITEIFGSTLDAPVFGKSCQTTNANPIF